MMKKMYILLICLYVLQLILAFICGPYSCKWGNTVYFYTGIANLLAAFILPLIMAEGLWPHRLLLAALFLLGSAIVWVIGFMVFDFKIMCRLF